MDKILIVFYIDVRGMTTQKVKQTLASATALFDRERPIGVHHYYVPFNGPSKVECINPLIINNDEQYQKIKELLEKYENPKKLIDSTLNKPID